MWRLVCLILGHRRIKGQARKRGGHHYADCTRCGVTLFRDPNTLWRPAREIDLLPRTIDLLGEAPPVADEPPAPPPRRRRRKSP